MNQSVKKLWQFAALFVVCAVDVYIIMQREKPPLAPSGNFNADSLSLIIQNDLKALTDSLSHDSTNVDLLVIIGNDYFDLGNHEKAIEYYEKALSLKPDMPLVLTDCAIMYHKHGDIDKALTYFDKAIKLKPDLAPAYFNKGLILMSDKNKPQEAIATWKKYIELEPNSEYAKLIKQQIETMQAGESQ